MTRPSFITHAVLQRQPDRDQLQTDVERFLAQGGQIQQLEHGAVSEMNPNDIRAARRAEGLRRHRANKRAGTEESE